MDDKCGTNTLRPVGPKYLVTSVCDKYLVYVGDKYLVYVGDLGSNINLRLYRIVQAVGAPVVCHQCRNRQPGDKINQFVNFIFESMCSGCMSPVLAQEVWHGHHIMSRGKEYKCRAQMGRSEKSESGDWCLVGRTR